MSHKTKDAVGAENAKTPDSDIQGSKGGKRNRAAIEAGATPAPAGEPRPPGSDPRGTSPGRRGA